MYFGRRRLNEFQDKEVSVKIGIMSDSHENMGAIRKVVDLFNKAGVEMVYHAGDIISPITYKEFSSMKSPMICSFGNNDGDRSYLKQKFGTKTAFYDFYSGNIFGRRVFMCHHPDFCEEIADSGAYDLVIYGHTHEVDIRNRGKALIINPGETGGWLTGRKTVVVLDTGDMKYDLYDIS